MFANSGEKVAYAIKFAEKVLLVGIALLTVFATLEEIWQIYLTGSVQLADLLEREGRALIIGIKAPRHGCEERHVVHRERFAANHR